jgi:nucleoside-diphosphate-sugar epimerase
MLNLLSVADAVEALARAIDSDVQGVVNVPGADTLPLSRVIACAGRLDLPVPGPLLSPLYGLRRLTLGTEFRYDMNQHRFHFSAVLDGTRAHDVLGYVPRHRLDWSSVAKR